ncbi:MAG: hypothetical protein V3S38_00960 [Acidimicrobiia bacterium]
MSVVNVFKAVDSGGMNRYWAKMTCPRCAGLTVVEHNAPEKNVDQVLRVFPEPDGLADSQISHLPNDVEEYYLDAARVMKAPGRGR